MSRIFLALLILMAFTSGCKKSSPVLFQKIKSSHSNIHFKNQIEEWDGVNVFNFTNYYNGGGVGIGDFNNDGLNDICFTSNQKNPELYINKGKFVFENASASSGLTNGGWMTGISIVDINNDGWPDIYLSMASHSGIKNSKNKFYINQKTNPVSFKDQAADYGLDYAGFTTQTAFFDYDKDGDLDVYMLNSAPDDVNPNTIRPRVDDGSFPSSDKLFENTGQNENGIAIFKDVSLAKGITFEGLGLGISLADFNNDGYTDIYASNDFLSNDILYLNDQGKGFTNIVKSATGHTSMFGMGIDAADLNNDQRVDIFQLDMLPEDNLRQKKMIARDDYQKKSTSTSERYKYHKQYMRNSLQLNMGEIASKPIFSERGLLYGVACTDWSWSVLLADFDLDGMKDIHVSNGYRKNVTDLDFINYYKNQNIFGDKTAQEKFRKEFVDQIPEVKLYNYAFKAHKNEPFEDVSAKWGLDDLSYSNGAAYGDLDNDGDLDLVVNNIDDEAFLYENKIENGHFLSVKLKGSPQNAQAIGAKVVLWQKGMSQVLENYPVRGFLSSMGKEMIFGLGNDSIIDSLQIFWPDQSAQKVQGLKANSIVNVEWQKGGMPFIYKEETPQNPLFVSADGIIQFNHKESDYVDFFVRPTLQKMLSRKGPVIKAGNFNGDTLTDFVIGGAYRGSPTQIFIQTTAGKFDSLTIIASQQMEVGDLLVFDRNGDGLDDIMLIPGVADVAIKNKEAYTPLFFENSANQIFISKAILPDIIVCSQKAILFDFDGDKDMDILITNHHQAGQFPMFGTHRYLINEGGKYVDGKSKWLAQLQSYGLITAVEEVDVDQDGSKELIILAEWQKPILLAKENGEFVVREMGLPSGWWKSLEVVDIDSDGDQDLVLGNEGLNSLYKTNEMKPAYLMGKDFNGDGVYDPIYALHLKDKLVSAHPLGTLTGQIVQFKKRYTKFDDYAKVGFGELFTENDLAGAQKFTATELRSMVAINDGKGNFTLNALPLDAQTAPASKIISGDFNKDGNVDLLVLGNFYPNESLVGPQDGSFGQLLIGDGKSGFQPMDNAKIGLWVLGDVRDALFLKKEQLIICTVNDGKAVGLKCLQ